MNVLLIRPRHFGHNPDTAASNRFQSTAPPLDARAIQDRAAAEHDGLVAALRDAGVRAIVVDDTETPPKPDAVFPNNWVSFHEDGTVILYPMEAPSRRTERRRDVIGLLEREAVFRASRVIDLSPLERRGLYLEGTGSLVLDHRERVAYAALSSRTHAEAVAEFGRQLGFETVTFDTRDETGVPLYHTNVMLSIGEHFAVICADAIPDLRQRRAVLDRLAATGRKVLPISRGQMNAFAANILELATGGGRRVIAMSETARQAFEPAQLERLAANADIMAAAIPTIERVGGGSVRCMLAEIFV